MYEKKKKNLMEIIHDFYICKTGEKFTTIQFWFLSVLQGKQQVSECVCISLTESL